MKRAVASVARAVGGDVASALAEGVLAVGFSPRGSALGGLGA
ncbi:hypothetical protein ODS41_06300 [Pyrobaculum sp. 3827-6]|nr:hypothetical protein [Pyrobaculum sp. 3827-6]MCU7787526.1 hypothetical protein [Pyrobaculum sp. 3827-6]